MPVSSIRRQIVADPLKNDQTRQKSRIRGFLSSRPLEPPEFTAALLRPVSLASLRALLEENLSLPKDELLYRSYMSIRENSFRFRDRDLERSFLWALTGPTASEAERLAALSQANCWPAHLCGAWSCWLCRQIEWLKRRAVLANMAVGVSAADFSYLTIIVGVTHDGIDAAASIRDQFESEYRAVFEDWPSIRWHGRFELDYVLPNSAFVTATKLLTLASLGYQPRLEMGALVPHLHAILIHPQDKRERIGYLLKRNFRGNRRVRLDPLWKAHSIKENLDRLSRYPIKNMPPSEAAPGRGSIYMRPRQPDEMRFFSRAVEGLGGLEGLAFDSLD